MQQLVDIIDGHQHIYFSFKMLKSGVEFQPLTSACRVAEIAPKQKAKVASFPTVHDIQNDFYMPWRF